MTLTETRTWAEIQQQPALWEGWAQSPHLANARAWIESLGPREVWLCGAGTSAYIGDIVASGLEGQGRRLRAIPTTDLVSRPRAFLPTDALIVHFGRSGDSAESLGLLDALDALSPGTPRLHVTCNPKGQLAIRPAPSPWFSLVLPEAAHDAGFAMTSSFSTMLLSALALLGPDPAPPIPALAARLRSLLRLYAAEARPARTPQRLVFLGAGPLAYAARESALKVMELTAGVIPCLWDSTLGFRHGPKSFVQGATDIVHFLSPDPQAALNDRDLVAELRSQFPGARVTTLGPGGNLEVPMPEGAAYGAALVVPYAQILAATLSDRLSLKVDDPFAGKGTLSRVVQGVRLHPVTA